MTAFDVESSWPSAICKSITVVLLKPSFPLEELNTSAVGGVPGKIVSLIAGPVHMCSTMDMSSLMFGSRQSVNPANPRSAAPCSACCQMNVVVAVAVQESSVRSVGVPLSLKEYPIMQRSHMRPVRTSVTVPLPLLVNRLVGVV